MEHKEVNALMERWAEKAAEVKADKRLVLHTETTPVLRATPPQEGNRVTRLMKLQRWSSAACIAVAMAVGLAIFVIPESRASITCTVNGKRITDPVAIEQHTLEALELVGESLRRPAATLSSTLGADPTMTRVGEMLNELTIDR